MVHSIPLYGLVLTGGKSKRMQKEKSLLSYHGIPQVQYVYQLLEPLCPKVFISLRAEQLQIPEYQKFPQIVDAQEFSDIGPLGGILSAMQKFPEAAWLVLACDLPFVDRETLEHLIQKRNPDKIATSYLSEPDQLPEPLCAIYEPKSREVMLQFVKNSIHCPRKILRQSDFAELKQLEGNRLDNINSPEEFTAALERLRKLSP